jgi:uncharacterized protein
MGKGISIYMGLGYSLEENIIYMRAAKAKGFDRLFTSLHIPEANYAIIIDEFTSIIKEAKESGMEVIADISPKGFEYLKIGCKELDKIKAFGIDVLRIDFGFTPYEIAEFSKNSLGLKIEINASTVTEAFLNALDNYDPAYGNIQACHNYYPRLNTGISVESLLKKNSMLKKYGMEISAFIPSQVNRRGPIYEGLPTIEKHRFVKPEICAKHLYALGIDNIFFGDSIPSEEEIKEVGAVPEGILELKVKPLTGEEKLLGLVDDVRYTNRPDGAEDVIRAQESRMNLGKDIVIKPSNTIERQRGTITVDNENYLRYMGELQICLTKLPGDSRVNVIGRVIEEEIFLLNYIGDEGKFKFKLV